MRFSRRPTHFKHKAYQPKKMTARDSKNLEADKLKDLQKPSSFSPAQEAKVEKVMHEYKQGKLRDSHGNPVTNRQQAVAIALSEARNDQPHIVVEKKGNKRFFAKAPSITSQYLGFGKNKTEAKKEAEETIKEHNLQERRVTTEKQVLKGGIGDKTNPDTLNKAELKKGMSVEREHTTNKAIQKEIATDHLTEDPDYYRKLKLMEANKRMAKEYRGDLSEGRTYKHPRNQDELQEQYFKGRTNGKSASTSVEGNKIYSYGTVIGVTQGRNFYLNTNKYSTTTSKQQNKLRQQAKQAGYDVIEKKPEQPYGRTDNRWADEV